MSITNFKAKVSTHTILASTFQYISFELISPTNIEFAAGQYLMLTIPGLDQKRSYSIASKPSLDHKVDVVIDIKPDGPGSQYLKNLKPGDEVEFMAPAGQFVLVDDPAEEHIDFIATGSGITPIRSMIYTLLQDKGDTRPMHLHWGMRYIEDMFWEEDFHQLAEAFPNFSFDPVLSKASQKWPLCQGHVGDCLIAHHQSFNNTGYYMCGNTKMIKEVSAMLEEKGVDKSHIHHEKFY